MSTQAASVKTPITLIAGPLGSGKTTLLRRVLDEADRRFAVIMNEFGEIAVDSRVIQGRNINYIELTGGCVCCSLAGEFEAAVRELLNTVHPEWIVLEATGVAEADALVYSVEESVKEVRLDCVVCIVDAWANLRYPSVGYATRSQLESADLVLLNKIDLVTPEDLPPLRERINEVAERALVVETERCAIDLQLLFGPGSQSARERPAASQAASRQTVHGSEKQSERFGGSPHAIQSFTLTLEGAVDRERFLDFLASLPPEAYRSKGFVRFGDGGQSMVNCVAGRCELEDSAARKVQMVFIGPGIEGRRAEIAAALLDCRS